MLLCLISFPFSAVAGSPTGVLEQYDFTAPQVRYGFPSYLREPSGLAYLDAGRVLTHDDNFSVLYLVNYLQGTPPERLRSPVPPMRGDFEGIAVLAGSIYLLTSHGTLLRIPLVEGTTLELLITGVEGRCNFEGLAARSVQRDLILACKYIHDEVTADVVHLYRFDIERGVADPEPIVVDVAASRAKYRLRRIRPSGIEWIPGREHFLLLAGKERLLLELDNSYSVSDSVRLSKRFHRQAEGITLDEVGRLILTDEADGRKATLAVYDKRRTHD